MQWYTETLIPAVASGGTMRLCATAGVRVWLGISQVGSVPSSAISTRPIVAQNAGMPMPTATATMPPFRLVWPDDGLLVRAEWWGVSSAAPPNNAFWVLEMFDDGGDDTSHQHGLLLPSALVTPGEIMGGSTRADEIMREIMQARVRIHAPLS